MARKVNSISEYVVGGMKVRVGTMDKKNPSTLFVAFSMHIEPVVEEKSYRGRVKSMTDSFKRHIDETVRNGILFHGDYIFIDDIPTDSMKHGKKTYIEIQAYLKVKPNIINAYDGDFKGLTDSMMDGDVGRLTEWLELVFKENGFAITENKDK